MSMRACVVLSGDGWTRVPSSAGAAVKEFKRMEEAVS